MDKLNDVVTRYGYDIDKVVYRLVGEDILVAIYDHIEPEILNQMSDSEILDLISYVEEGTKQINWHETLGYVIENYKK